MPSGAAAHLSTLHWGPVYLNPVFHFTLRVLSPFCGQLYSTSRCNGISSWVTVIGDFLGKFVSGGFRTKASNNVSSDSLGSELSNPQNFVRAWRDIGACERPGQLVLGKRCVHIG